jgi:hypothetical protein
MFLTIATAMCFCSQFNTAHNQSLDYTVVRIDSVENYYLIYAKRNDSTFQIASKKVKVVGCTKLRVNDKYSFKLKSRIFTGEVGGRNISPATNDLVKCVGLDEDTVVCIDDNCVNDLFYSENIEDACYRP